MRRIPAFLALCGALALPASPAQPQTAAIALELPVDCALPQRCAVQFHVDRRPGPEIGDYRCGRLSYDGHRGTDFRVLSPEDFAAGIPVLAAAAGRVAAVRDGMDDIDVTELERERVEGRAGGNQVVLVHDGGWETHYWHLRKGSVAVQPGQTVSAGARLGIVGLSGDTNFPHLHFELRRERRIVDPFDVGPGDPACTATSVGLWTESAAAILDYAPVFAQLGFTTRQVTRADATYGRAPRLEPGSRPQELFLWFELYGLAKGDRVSLQWTLPDGRVRNPAQFIWQEVQSYAFRTGKLNLPPPLPAGTYSVRLTVVRDERTLYERDWSIAIK